MSIEERIPQHVAIIMDGNGRWAQLRGKARAEGHMAGVEPMRICIKAAQKYGVRYLTFYAFSTENWGRPAAEVEALMELLCRCVIQETPELKAQGVRVRIIGERSRFSERVRSYLNQIEADTAEGEVLTMVLALNYSSRDELRRATRQIATEAAAGKLAPEEVTEQLIAERLDTAFMPDPDLIIRTSGEQRLSNFLMWQAAYAEFYFPEVLWPDFTTEEFVRALEVYAQRDRRFGKLNNDNEDLSK